MICCGAIGGCALPERALDDGEIRWDTAKLWIKSGNVREIFQSQGHILLLTMKGGGHMFKTYSTRLDEVLEIKDQCGAPCVNLTISMD